MANQELASSYALEARDVLQLTEHPLQTHTCSTASRESNSQNSCTRGLKFRQMGPGGIMFWEPSRKEEWQHVALQNFRHQVSNRKKHVSWHTCFIYWRYSCVSRCILACCTPSLSLGTPLVSLCVKPGLLETYADTYNHWLSRHRRLCTYHSAWRT